MTENSKSDNRSVLTVRIDSDVHKRLKHHGVERRVSLGTLVEEAVTRLLDEGNEQNPDSKSKNRRAA